jgi:hypothetical protein
MISHHATRYLSPTGNPLVSKELRNGGAFLSRKRENMPKEWLCLNGNGARNSLPQEVIRKI